MIIKKIYIRNFRNIEEAELLFSDSCNIFYGDNAEGKTNLLEAVSLCIGKSFRNSKPYSFIPFDSDKKPQIKLWYESDNYIGKENLIEYNFEDNKALIKTNGISQKNAIDLYGEMKYVFFVPEQLLMIKGVPELRRDYIDCIVMLQNKSHKKIMESYREILNHRNVLVNEIIEGRANSSMLSVWDDFLVKQGVNLTFGRIKYLSMIKEFAKEFYHLISGGEEILDIYYNSSVFGKIFDINTVDFNDKCTIYDVYSKKLEVLNALNDFCGIFRTNIGAHRDDIIFMINGKNAREFGSQGQLRSIYLVLKLAEARMIKEYNKETPVLLLDEALSELDGGRRNFVINNFNGAQVFLTSCNKGDLKRVSKSKIWKVRGGRFELYTLGQ
ncbi:MAG: DNA replication and repair protein RecF [Eubacterium sp.]|jgi:DNA replication and repair protein RecF|nr:DNA replication and repair protein RecF [Eubacterium sp.]